MSAFGNKTTLSNFICFLFDTVSLLVQTRMVLYIVFQSYLGTYPHVIVYEQIIINKNGLCLLTESRNGTRVKRLMIFAGELCLYVMRQMKMFILNYH